MENNIHAALNSCCCCMKFFKKRPLWKDCVSAHGFFWCFKPTIEFMWTWKMEMGAQNQYFTNLPLPGLTQSTATDLIRSVLSWLTSGPPSPGKNNIWTIQVWVPRHHLNRTYITETPQHEATLQRSYGRPRGPKGHLIRLDVLSDCDDLASSSLVLRMFW